MQRWKYILIGFGLIALFGAGLGTRYAILKANQDAYDGDVPFTLESAIQFRNVQLIYEGEGLTGRDPMIQYPEGIEVFRTDTVLAEYVYAGLARLLPDAIPLPDRVRWIMLAWFSLTIPFMAVWVAAWTRSRSAGAVAGLLYAVALAAVIRSTGLEMSRENFALPFLLAHFAFDVLAMRRPHAYAGPALGSALCLGLALAAWDMIQFYVILWAIVFFLRAIRGQLDQDPSARFRWCAQAGALILVGLLSPYHRAHGLLLAPPLLLAYGAMLQMAIAHRIAIRRPARLVIALVPLALYLLVPHAYGESYGHFAELLFAKIRFLNSKPMDPSLLTFNQRIMWVPALDSASWALTRTLFPAMLYLVLAAIANALLVGPFFRKKPAESDDANLLQYIFFFCSSLIAYVLFVRFHVYVAVFGVACIGWWWAWSLRRRGWAPVLVCPLIFFALVVEAAQVLEEPGRWGRPNVYYREVRELTEWLNEYAAPEPVLANFGVSASVLTYGGCPIILHPKFETRAIRERVRSYGETLFKESEETFRDWADEHGAEYFVYALGEFAPRSPELQMRYFVDALEPPDHAAARVFEFAPHEAVYFEYLWGNRKYRVFRVITREDERQADQLTIFSERALERGDLRRAEEYAWAALTLFPAQYRAREVLRHAAALKAQGFDYEPAEEVRP